MKSYDLIAIGGGTAGLVTAAGAANLGLSVALIERDALGGDCLWTGCVPSKALIASAKLAYQMRNAAALGLVESSPSPAHAFDSVMQRVRRAREHVSHHDDPQRFRDMGVDVQFGEAHFSGNTEIKLNGTSLSAKKFVIATGAEAAVPPIDGLADTHFITHATAFEQSTLPKRLVIIGGGPIGLEFAQVYSRLGATVTVVEMLPRLLSNEDEDVTRALMSTFGAEGINILLGTAVKEVRNNSGVTIIRVEGETDTTELEVDGVFVATGRRPRTRGFGLEDIGVETNPGGVTVDHALRTSVRNIWGAGDVVGGPQFTHVADYQAKLVLRNAFFPFSSRASYDNIPSVIYTDPEVARVGMSEGAAVDKYGDDAKTYRYDFSDLDRAIVDEKGNGFVKLISGPRDRILGATVVASDAGNLIMPIVLAMQKGMKLTALSRVVYPYPTMAEGVKRAADNYYREKFKGNTGDWLRRVVRWLN